MAAQLQPPRRLISFREGMTAAQRCDGVTSPITNIQSRKHQRPTGQGRHQGNYVR